MRELLPAKLQATTDELVLRKDFSIEQTAIARSAALAEFLLPEYADGRAARGA